MVGKFRKKPVKVEAVQWTGRNFDEVQDFAGHAVSLDTSTDRPELTIKTMEGFMHPKYFDWVIKGVCGEFYSCDYSIFEATYEPVE